MVVRFQLAFSLIQKNNSLKILIDSYTKNLAFSLDLDPDRSSTK
jgi:hypothetical protein